MKSLFNSASRKSMKWASMLLALALLVVGATSLSARQLPPDLSSSSKSVSNPNAPLNSTIVYTLNISNSGGDATTSAITVTDPIPAGVTYVAGSLNVPAVSGVTTLSSSDTGNMISWSGFLGANTSIAITFQAEVTSATAMIGDTIVNIMIVNDGTTPITRSATTTVGEEATGTVGLNMFLPIMAPSFPPRSAEPVLNAITDDTDDGIYTVTWQEAERADSYILQEDDDSDFSSPIVVYVGANTTWTVPENSDRDNGTYYYRVLGRNTTDFPLPDGDINGDSKWSNTVVAEVIRGIFLVDETELTIPECTDLRWEFEGVKAVNIQFGENYDFEGVPGVRDREVCPSRTTTYTARVTEEDDSITEYTQTVTVDGEGCAKDPIINFFDSTDFMPEKDEEFTLSWSIECASAIYLTIDDGAEIPVQGNEERELSVDDDTTFKLRVLKTNGVNVYSSLAVVVP